MKFQETQEGLGSNWTNQFLCWWC